MQVRASVDAVFCSPSTCPSICLSVRPPAYTNTSLSSRHGSQRTRAHARFGNARKRRRTCGTRTKTCDAGNAREVADAGNARNSTNGGHDRDIAYTRIHAKNSAR
eukprot:6210453-Pleurochrysis_carterae.AAC.4